MDKEDLKDYVGASGADDDYIESCWDNATELVDQFIGDSSVPDDVYDRACLEVGSELFHRRQAPNGVAQFQTLEGAPVRVARNPMLGAYPLLQPYVGLGVA